MKHLFDFSIIIPTYNNKSEAERCIESLLNQQKNTFEILICDDGSSDGTVEMIENKFLGFQNIKLFQHPDKKNHGRSANRNQALGRLMGKYVLFLDSDMEASSTLLAAHYNLLEEVNNSVSIGKIIYHNQKSNFWAKYLSSRGVGKLRNRIKHTHYYYFMTANSALPSNWFEEIGGFDEKMKKYGGEDTEFACRLKKIYNPNFYYNPYALVHSDQKKTYQQALSQIEEFATENLKYIVQKHDNCTDIFKLSIFTSNCLLHKMVRFFFRKWIYDVFCFICPKLPGNLGIFLFNYCVAYRIFKGFSKKICN